MSDRNSLRSLGRLKAAISAALLIPAVACAHSTPTSEASKATPEVQTSAQNAPAILADNTPETNPPEFNASRAMKYAKEIVAFGPRPLGSEGHKKAENYILARLKGDDVERDDFEINTAEGRFPVTTSLPSFRARRTAS